MNISLLIHNVGFIASALATITAIFFLTLNNIKSKGHIPLALTLVGVVIFIVSHVVGVNTIDPEISKNILMFNMIIFFLGMFNVHAVLSAIGKDQSRKYILIFIYALGIIFVLWFLVYPHLFLEPSVPKMYFPNYYEPGVFNWIRVLYLYGICWLYMIYELVMSYRIEENVYRKSQLKYLTIAYIFAYVLGYIPNFLIYDIKFDPLWGMAFMVLFAAAFLYGAIRYELMNIKVVAKQASVYGLVIGFIGGSIILFQYLSRVIETSYPNFPAWIIPSVSVFLVLVITLLVWRKIREVDLLKYEFITTVTHKFRTPLTQIRWSVEGLAKSSLSNDDKDQVEHIQSANGKLVELTNLLVNISEVESSAYQYRIEKLNIKDLAEDVLGSLDASVKAKKIVLNKKYEGDAYVRCDASRIKFVIQTFIENAINYSPLGGTIEISLSKKADKAYFAVKDSGIGVPKDEMQFIFSKFYRGNKARSTDTEGMGIGLFISKEVISRHRGKIKVESEGVNMGSTFSFSLPLVV